jgi:hypothetical protein
MSCWEPHIDLMRLLEALGREINAATEVEIRQACTEEKGRSIAACCSAWPELQVEGGSSAVRIANEVRELIEAVSGDPSDISFVEKGYIELRRPARSASRNAPPVSDPSSLPVYDPDAEDGPRHSRGKITGVRTATEQDGPAIAAIYAPYVRNTAVFFEEMAPTSAEMSERVRATLPTHPFLAFREAYAVIP